MDSFNEVRSPNPALGRSEVDLWVGEFTNNRDSSRCTRISIISVVTVDLNFSGIGNSFDIEEKLSSGIRRNNNRFCTTGEETERAFRTSCNRKRDSSNNLFGIVDGNRSTHVVLEGGTFLCSQKL